MQKVVFAYSGGVDDLICIHHLQNSGFNVITLLAQLGQVTYLEPLGERAVNLGATVTHIVDLRIKFIREYILPALHAQSMYDNGYLLSAALSRPLIAEELVRIADEENSIYVAHGARATGNDYIRFNNCIHALNPNLQIITPLKELNLYTIQDSIKYIKKFKLPLTYDKNFPYNAESNLWGVNIHLGNLADEWSEPSRDSYIITTPVIETLDKTTTIKIKLEQGIPVSIDNKKMDLLNIIEMLNNIGGHSGIGRVDMIENKISGEKIRETYEAPAATILYTAYRTLCEMILPKETIHFFPILSSKYADLIYNGLCFSPLKKAMDSLFKELSIRITGSVKLKLYKGNLSVIDMRLR
ncbi:MAG: argininosuccinate synthase [Planctomycetota bacterium]|nr:argininosuccinate synthase [Planctomycetota bacterium]MDI6787604.1 argininosuccinate synthase [Planctomycetota bacterium]